MTAFFQGLGLSFEAAWLISTIAGILLIALPLMLSVRSAADSLEGLIADDLWPLPTYQEMLFIR